MTCPIILVTGATGKVGRLLVQKLAERNDVQVRAAVRSPQKARALISGVRICEMDYARPDSVKRAMQGVQKLFLLTPGGSEQVEQTWIAVEAAMAAGVQHIVRLGSLLPDPEQPSIEVEHWSAMTERMVIQSGLNWTMLRPSWFNQNFTAYIFAAHIKKGWVLAPIGEARAGWIDCRDIADVAVAALTHPGHEKKNYTLTGPALIGMPEIIAHLSKASGRRIRYVSTPEALQWMLARLSGFPKRDVNALMELLAKLKNNRLTQVTDHVESILGRPAISFEQFARDHAQMLRP